MLDVSDGHVTLGVGADFQWALLNAAGDIIAGPERCALTADQYNAWGADDSAVAKAVAQNLALVPV